MMQFLKKKKQAHILRVCKKYSVVMMDLIFPRFCVGCGTEGTWLCPKCQKQTVSIQMQTCPACKRISQNGVYCLKCRPDKFLDGVIVADYFEEGPTKEIIHNFKYNHVLELKKYLGGRLVNAYLKSGISAEIITFTPLHFRRLASRGYNQSEVLAGEVGGKVKIPVSTLLHKVKNTKRQVGLIGELRRKNLTGVFLVKRANLVKGQEIIIIDDILTTGTTLNECAKVLKEAGAKKVWGLVLAKG